jgi:hypothetical protein
MSVRTLAVAGLVSIGAAYLLHAGDGRAGLLTTILPDPEPEPPMGYDPAYCGGPHGSPEPTFYTAIDLPVLLAGIGEYTLNPNAMYGPDDPWTNW